MIRVKFASGYTEVFDAWHFNVGTDGAVDMVTEEGDVLAAVAPGHWVYVLDLDPTEETS